MLQGSCPEQEWKAAKKLMLITMKCSTATQSIEEEGRFSGQSHRLTTATQKHPTQERIVDKP